MAKFYSKERSKYGSGTGTIIIWTIEHSNLDPNAEVNIKNLPAGYLKCDGSVYSSSDYPALAEILGTGMNSKFIRYNVEGDPIDDLEDDEFIVPDLGSKYPKPTTGGSAGSYINILTRNQLGIEKFRSGMGIESSSVVGSTIGSTTSIPLTYAGNFIIPSQEIGIKGKPSWSVGTGNTGYTDVEAVSSLALHPHMHFSTTNRLRIKTKQETTEPTALGVGYYKVGSTIPIQQWLNNTEYGNEGAGTNQPPCWAIASGKQASQYPSSGVDYNFVTEKIYYNLCYDAKGSAGLASFRYYCLLTSATDFDLGSILFHPEPTVYTTTLDFFGGLLCLINDTDGIGQTKTVDPTYTAGALGVPNDYNESSLADVVPYNLNSASKTSQIYSQVNNVFSEVQELEQETDPTIHSHKIILEKFDHTFMVKTDAYLLSPDNLRTTLTLKTDQVASLDQVTSPYIILEYLIKY